MATLGQYISEHKLGELKSIDPEKLPEILGDFYFSLCKQKKKEPKTKKSHLQLPKADKNYQDDDKYYKNSLLKAGRAVLNHHFKAEMGIDIISNSKFIKTNEISQAITKQGKTEGCGEIESKNATNDKDMSKLNTYFITNMQGPPNAKLLQEIVLLNIIYYGGQKGTWKPQIHDQKHIQSTQRWWFASVHQASCEGIQ